MAWLDDGTFLYKFVDLLGNGHQSGETAYRCPGVQETRQQGNTMQMLDVKITMGGVLSASEAGCLSMLV